MSFLSLPRIQEESSQCPLAFCNSCWRIKRFLYSFFPVHCIEIWDDTNPFCTAILRAVFCKSLHWMLTVVSWFFNTVVLYFAWNSFSSASSTRFFYSWWAPIAWNSFYKPAFDRLLPMEIVLLSGVLRSRHTTVQDATRRKSFHSLEWFRKLGNTSRK